MNLVMRILRKCVFTLLLLFYGTINEEFGSNYKEEENVQKHLRL